MSKIGVLTGGGDCPGLNAVIRAITKKAISIYDIEVYGFLDGFKGLVNNNYIKLDLLRVSGIGHLGGTILGTTNRDNPFEFYSIKNGIEFKSDQSDQAIENMKKLGLDALIVIGGDGSLNIALKFYEKGVNIIGVPKTIDNDLMCTDVTFGFNTAVNTASDAIDKLHTTAESHHRVMILEVMGRYAGWIALHAGISGGADVILIPEIQYEAEYIINKIRSRYEKNKKFSIIVIAEGATGKNQDMAIQKVVDNSHDPIRLGGIGNRLAKEIEELTDIETRVTVLGHLQRGGSPVPYDRILSTRYGVAAVKSVVDQKYGNMVSLQGTEIVNIPITEAVKDIKRVEPNSHLVESARSLGISFGDR
ncbi:6-phosphofructokinase [Candidatus Syntrophocurvum alkaliphilum]|uniref:6-phosphofructokinase n=1 Tax=Candidatus Syntrophocurvum alkaliphilum TaxID=2293317 RepID=UPI001FAA69ED|nr:ATP-dependent 6-phosphofructokinase [Candidatus Syntrophocurvum alkaliphilum]